MSVIATVSLCMIYYLVSLCQHCFPHSSQTSGRLCFVTVAFCGYIFWHCFLLISSSFSAPGRLFFVIIASYFIVCNCLFLISDSSGASGRLSFVIVAFREEPFIFHISVRIFS